MGEQQALVGVVPDTADFAASYVDVVAIVVPFAVVIVADASVVLVVSIILPAFVGVDVTFPLVVVSVIPLLRKQLERLVV